MALSQQLIQSGRGIAGSAYFTAGMSSAADPMFIDDRSYRASMNTVNRGGVVQTRPGYRTLLEFPDGKAQGTKFFKPVGSAPYIATAIGGSVYATKAPFRTYSVLPNISFLPGAKNVYWEVATKAVQRKDDGTLEAIAPKKVLVMQDGGYSCAAYWDGGTSRHLNPAPAAILSAALTDGKVSSIDVIAGGGGYTVAPVLKIDAPPATGTSRQATATAVLKSGAVFEVVITDAGAGYETVPNVVVEGSSERSETPLGGPMCWSGDRLWVARDNKLFASDISDPLSFVENAYAAEGGFFLLPERIVAMAEIPALEIPQLLVFTETQTWIFQSGIRDRSTWKATPYFQRQLFPDIGAASHRAVCSQYGLIWWFSMTGLTNMNAAAQSRISSELLAKDAEMAVSKGNLSPCVDRVAMAAFENYLLCSVPSGHRYNHHTWVMDASVVASLQGSSGPAWNSYWTGTRPVEWTKGPVDGVLRIFHLSVDQDGKNRLWEAFTPDRADNTLPVTCFVETKTHNDFSQKATGLDLKKFLFAELNFAELVGNVSAAVYWSGTRGRYKRIATFDFVASEGPYQLGHDVDTTRAGYLPQTRIVRTPAVQPKVDECSVCGTESRRLDNVDFGYSLLVVWSGRAALRSYRLFADPEEESGTGAAISTLTETGPKIVEGSLCG